MQVVVIEVINIENYSLIVMDSSSGKNSSALSRHSNGKKQKQRRPKHKNKGKDKYLKTP